MKFGVREIVDVVFKATTDGQRIGDKTFKKYQPVFMIDTATTSSLEQATTTVYAQGGKGYNRLIAWEGEKTMTFTVTDALMSPMGLAVLTGAGLITPNKANQTHVHATINAFVDENGEAKVTLDDLNQEMGLDAIGFDVCNTIEAFATELDGSGAAIGYYDNVKLKDAVGDYFTVNESTPAIFTVANGTTLAKSVTVQLDFYVIMNNAVTEVHIEPSSFGGFFYVEAQTLFRREDTGKDMAAELIIPKAKVQSGFTFTMAASGDPSTFDFVMDAFPGYTRFDSTTKKMCVIQVVGVDKTGESDNAAHTHTDADTNDSPSFLQSLDVSRSTKVLTNHIPTTFAKATEFTENQNKANIAMSGSNMNITVTGGVASLNVWTSTDPGQALLGDKPWLALDIDTGFNDITKVKYNGSQLTAQDVEDATAWGLEPGHFILWIKADDVKGTPKTFTLSSDEDPNTITVTITVADV